MARDSYDSAREYRRFLTEELREGGSEFGGAAGNVQPYPHEMSSSETLHAIYAGDTTDPGVEIFTDEAAPPMHLRED
ncbi:hypothetical protein [Actinoplanes auranticolor]|uniref:Uncharacterized protein n=1 Tax=Actinoplanes auranticolor TaxID=47988 RepID=A0A919SS67_9ACTN|nr:hypothetical protein [Actinoplanes auranticolor]GIM78045.1 hypothetical protein Aau02nite_78970 [Actinoplanes auranticolor]